MTVGTTNSTNCQTASETATDLCKWFPWSFSIFTLNIQNERRKCFHLHVVDLWRIEQFTDIFSITYSNEIVCKKSLTVKPIGQNMLLAVKFGINYWNSIIVQLVFTMTQLLSTKTKLYSHRILVVNQKLMWHSFWSFSFLFQYGISNKPPNCVVSERQSSQYFVM